MAGFFKKLFGSRAESVAISQITELDNHFIRFSQRGFFGQYTKSPNGRYLIAWRDSNDEGTHGGARRSGQGRYLLLDNDRIICEGRMERPNHGKVADNGLFILNDWRFFSNHLRGTFYAFNPVGEPIIRQPFKANLFNNGISHDGRFAVCQTCNSGDERDSSVLAVFDLKNGREFARWRPESGWANAYRFTQDGVHVVLEYPQKASLAYTLAGEFVDREKWLDNSIARGEAYIIERTLREAGKNPAPEFVDRLLAGLQVALSSTRDDDPRGKAYVLRLKGECLDARQDPVNALLHFDAALALNPKVGSRKRAEQIRKLLTKSAR